MHPSVAVDQRPTRRHADWRAIFGSPERDRRGYGVHFTPIPGERASTRQDKDVDRATWVDALAVLDDRKTIRFGEAEHLM